jgi:hypothetical protein
MLKLPTEKPYNMHTIIDCVDIIYEKLKIVYKRTGSSSAIDSTFSLQCYRF